jgi:hypothetical protein
MVYRASGDIPVKNFIYGLIALFSFFPGVSSAFAEARASLLCTTPDAARVETLTVNGSGKLAQIRLDDNAISGDFSYNAVADGQAGDDLDGTSEYQDLAFVGSVTSKTSHNTFAGSFYVSPGVSQGLAGTIYLYTGSHFTSFSCQ